MKLQRLTKSIVSAHSNKPKGTVFFCLNCDLKKPKKKPETKQKPKWSTLMIFLYTATHSGRQVKMAFIHTVAKPPRDVRIQQEIHGTAVQQPPQGRCR